MAKKDEVDRSDGNQPQQDLVILGELISFASVLTLNIFTGLIISNTLENKTDPTANELGLPAPGKPGITAVFIIETQLKLAQA